MSRWPIIREWANPISVLTNMFGFKNPHVHTPMGYKIWVENVEKKKTDEKRKINAVKVMQFN